MKNSSEMDEPSRSDSYGSSGWVRKYCIDFGDRNEATRFNV